MKFKIPTQFDLAGQTFKVFLKEDMEKQGALGMCYYKDQEIWIEKNLKPTDQIPITFYHELFHALFHTLGKEELKSDEGLVDALGNLLWQYHKTAKYD